MYFKPFAFASLIASVMAADIPVMVGMNATLTFTPAQFTANVGDIVHFTFVAGNHTVFQSTFADPCTLAPGGFTNAFQPVAKNATSFTTVQLAVNSTDPIWFYCAQKVPKNHCENGMVGVINPTSNMTFNAFQSKALALGNNTNTTSSPTSTSPNSSTTSITPSGGNSGNSSQTGGSNNTGGGVLSLKPSLMLTGSSAVLLSLVASAMVAL